MKKIMMTLAAAMMAVTMNAQVFVGGELGFSSSKNGAGDRQTAFRILPEIGYSFNDEWAVGVSLGYNKGTADMQNYSYGNVDDKGFVVSPYARYNFINGKLVSLFVDGGVELAFPKDGDTYFGIGLKPGVALKLGDNMSFVTHIGFVGYKKQGDANKFGLDVDQNNLTFGLYYNF